MCPIEISWAEAIRKKNFLKWLRQRERGATMQKNQKLRSAVTAEARDNSRQNSSELSVQFSLSSSGTPARLLQGTLPKCQDAGAVNTSQDEPALVILLCQRLDYLLPMGQSSQVPRGALALAPSTSTQWGQSHT